MSGFQSVAELEPELLNPCDIQRRTISISAAVNVRPFPSGGIRMSASSVLKRTNISLASGSPGTMAAYPPRSSLADDSMSSRKPASRFSSSGPWQ